MCIFGGCLEGAWRVLGGCREGAWRMLRGCLEGIEKVSRRRPEGLKGADMGGDSEEGWSSRDAVDADA
jgi:hypothetical protein